MVQFSIPALGCEYHGPGMARFGEPEPMTVRVEIIVGRCVPALAASITLSISCFGEADGGTLFLGEISGFPLDAQAKLRRAVETCGFGRSA